MANKAKFFNYTYDPSARRSDDPDYISAVMRICEFLKPSASPYKLLRIGGAEDGAYLVPNDLSGVGACFSPGVNNFKNFETTWCDAGRSTRICAITQAMKANSKRP